MFIIMVKSLSESTRRMLNGREYVNLHDKETGRYGFEFEQCQASEFPTYDAAIKACKKIMWYAFPDEAGVEEKYGEHFHIKEV